MLYPLSYEGMRTYLSTPGVPLPKLKPPQLRPIAWAIAAKGRVIYAEFVMATPWAAPRARPTTTTSDVR